MEGGRRVEDVSDRDEKEGARRGVSRYAEQYGQSDVDVLESRAMKGGRRAVCTSDRDEFEGARRGASRHADQHS